ncbi:MAG: tartrate dehydrogenase [Cytophagales bacterium]|nr:tartrate dehydrogenase [Cytophaga sp.]
MKQHILLYKGQGIGPELFESLRAFFNLFEDIVEYSYIESFEGAILIQQPFYMLCGPLEKEQFIETIMQDSELVYTLTCIPLLAAKKRTNRLARILTIPLTNNSSTSDRAYLSGVLHQVFSTEEKIVLVQQYKEHEEKWALRMKIWTKLAFSGTVLQLEDRNLYSFIKHGEYERLTQIVTSAEIEKVLSGIYASANRSQNRSHKLIKTAKSTIALPIHGHAPDIAGMGIANPYAIIMALLRLLREMGYLERSQKAENQIERMFQSFPEKSTPDQGGILNTEKYIAMIVECINL